MSHSQSLLHVEDDGLVSRAVSRALTRVGFLVTTVDDCRKARASQGPFQFGLFDIDLTDGNGILVAEELLGNGIVEQVCFYTASVDSMLSDKTQRLGPLFKKSAGLSSLVKHLAGASPMPGIVSCQREDQPNSELPPASSSRPQTPMVSAPLEMARRA